MITLKSLITKVILLVSLTFAQHSYADSFTSADVLKWTEPEQASMFQTSVGMMMVAASQVTARADFVECLDDWYYKTDAVKASRNEAILDAMGRFPEHHPQIIILAVIEKQCGKFGG